MEKLELKIENTNGELIIREGNAVEPLPLREPNIIKIIGDIRSVSAFIKKRQKGHGSQFIDENKAIVTVDKHSRTITLQLDPENYYGASVTAKLEQSEELKQFGINTVTKFSRKQLLDLLRFNRLFFPDKNQHAQVLLGLSKLRIKSETEIQQERDNQGNKRSLHDVKTVDDGGLVKEFGITIPIYKGFSPQNITVEICFDVVNGDVQFWLESVGLKEAMESQIDDIFNTELQSCDGLVIINK
ncbi:DUF2303 family protein [Lacibacter sp. MH-610]|uniref:DUF2303 family protein n=1 Tax=Lacibacter sp. MH-610 TaxID=3020883 RepID=UPI0038914A50